MSKAIIVDEDGRKFKGGDVETDFAEWPFDFKNLPNQTPRLDGVKATFSYIVGFIPVFGSTWATAEWAQALDQAHNTIDLEDSFERYLKAEGATLETLSTRSGSVMTFMLQRYVHTPSDEQPAAPSIVRVTPVGFGADAGSALTYVLSANPHDATFTDRFNPQKTTELVHEKRAYQLRSGIFMAVNLANSKVVVTSTPSAQRLFRDARERAVLLGDTLLDEFEVLPEGIRKLRSDYLNVSELVYSIKDSKIRSIVNSSVESNREGFKRVNDLTRAYVKASSKAKATRFLSQLTMFMSFAASVQNYVEVRDAAADRKRMDEQRSKAFQDLTGAIGDLSSSLDAQAEQIGELEARLGDIDRKLTDSLLPREGIKAFFQRVTTEFSNDSRYLNQPTFDGDPDAQMRTDSFYMELQ